MQTLKQMLLSSEPHVLSVLVERWGVNTHRLSHDEILTALEKNMLDPERAEKIFDTLSDVERGALQTVIGGGGQMNTVMFERLYGEIRSMGVGKAERERPHENPLGVAETLYYLGLIGKVFSQVGVGIGAVVFVPDDLIGVLPIHKTGYNADALDALVDSYNPKKRVSIEPIPEDEITPIAVADTSIVDDVTTMLAYIQLHSPRVDQGFHMAEEDYQGLLPHLIISSESRLHFMFQIALTAELVEIQNKHAQTRRADVRRWLEESRSGQLRALVEAWRVSQHYRDLWHTPGLFPDTDVAGASYDPVEARAAFITLVRDYLPLNEWWEIENLITVVNAINPDFQRPGGDYDSWYIRNEENEYLHGVESWFAVEGAVLEFYIEGPMFWLGLIDLGEETARLNAYGRAFIDPQQRWVDSPPDKERIHFQEDGTLVASRKVSRFERFQLARFSTWRNPATLSGEPFVYRLDAEGLARASEQGINISHIQSFLGKFLGNNPMPSQVEHLLQSWSGGGALAQVTMERLIILRTTSPEMMDSIVKSPPLRRFLGARLGDTAVVVRADQWDELRMALGENGISTEVRFD